MLKAIVTTFLLKIKVIIIIKGTCHEIGISKILKGWFEKGINIKTGINVEIIISCKLITISINLLKLSIY